MGNNLIARQLLEEIKKIESENRSREKERRIELKRKRQAMNKKEKELKASRDRKAKEADKALGKAISIMRRRCDLDEFPDQETDLYKKLSE